MSSPLLCLVCGYENGGTTALSEVIRRDSSVDTGFEGGFLLADEPAAFRGVSPHFDIVLRGWGLAMADMDFVLAASDWDDLYRRLRERFAPDRPEQRLFDKTPAYLERLPEVMAKVPETPVVAIVRDPRGLFWSWRKRAPADGTGSWVKRYATRYLRYRQGLVEARDLHPERIHLVQYETLCLEPEATSQDVMRFLGLTADRTGFDPRFPNVRGTDLTTAFLLDHEEGLTPAEGAEILEATSEASEWFWEPPAGFDPDQIPEPTPSGPAVEPHPQERRRHMSRAAARSRGGPEWVGDHLIGPRITPREVVLDIGWLRVSPWERIAETRDHGYARRCDWLRDGSEGLDRAGGRYDAVVAHTVVPLLDTGGIDELFGALLRHLPPEGRIHLTTFPDDPGLPGVVAHGPEEIAAIGSRHDLVVAEVVTGHPAGQVLITLVRA